MSWFSNVESWFGKLFSSEANVVNEMHSAAAAIQLVTPPLILALQSAGKTEGSAEVVQVANEVTTDLGTLSQLLAQAQTGSTSAKAQIVATLESVKANLAQLEAAGHIKNAATLTEVTNVSNAFIAEAEVVIELLPTTTTTTA